MHNYMWHVFCQNHKREGKKIWVIKRCTRKTYERRLKYRGEDYLYFPCQAEAQAEVDRRNALEVKR